MSALVSEQIILSYIQSTSESRDALLTKGISGQAILKRKIFKRTIKCPIDEYSADNHCCKLCNKGTYLKSDCGEDHGEARCLPCTRGKDYMDQTNHLTHCERCKKCDLGQGLEELESCTVIQNTKCQCMKDYFCNSNSTTECNEHCHPCDKCENGVEEECTPTHNIVCKAGKRHLGLIALLLIVVISAPFFIYFYRKRNKKKSITENTHRSTEDTKLEEAELLVPEDIDLQCHLSEMSKKFTKEEMLNFIRHKGFKEAEIQAILNNNQNQEEEQKFKLLERWYQSHGKKGACRTLIGDLKKLRLNVLADDIMGTVSISNGKENVNSSSTSLEDRNERGLQSMEEGL
uniref:Tumor necrosis factor receptor superfamily member 6 n=1 Tax=Geotrypetes seraphini TaxID=260995 RepID=A0A6P8RES9_GEOSA|nr:tumor necrosis factor receptor superfamily member 6 isoform X2 [Geotrypetes seraphini]